MHWDTSLRSVKLLVKIKHTVTLCWTYQYHILDSGESLNSMSRLFKDHCTFAGEPMVAAAAGIWDNYNVKKQLLHSW